MSLTFGNPDPNILRSQGDFTFKDFAFNSIGKEPELLKRISNREEGVRYYSPSPEPEYPSAARNGVEARTRPTLLQALTSQAQESQGHAAEFQPPNPEPSSGFDSPGMDSDAMQLQYPETPVVDVLPATSIRKPTRPPSPPPPPPLPPFVPDYAALKELHTRLEASQKVLALPPPPKRAPTPPSEFPRPSLIAANNAVHHTEKTLASAKETLLASQVRVSSAEQSVTSAQTIVDTLTQALEAARAALEMAHKSLVEARHAAEEAQAALTASRVAADAAEETKRLLEEPPPPRVPSPEPIDPNAETICEMKKDLDALRLWVDEQEARHMPVPVAERDSSREREEEEEREASNMMIAQDDIDNDTDVEVRDAVAPEDGGEADMEIDESRRSEEDAAQALVELAEQKITNPDEGQRRPPSLKKDSVGKGNAESLTIPAPAESIDLTLREREALAREVILRKLQEAKREQVKMQKEQAQAAAAILILKERQDAAARNKNSVAQSSPPLPDADAEYHQSGTVIQRPVVLPPSTAETKVKAKKTKPVSGGVKLGPEITVKVEPSLPMVPSPEVERAAALGLRVRPTPSPPNSKTGPSSKKVRNQSVPPIAHLDRQSPDEISASRTGPDKGNIHIIPPTKAPKLPSNLSTDVQLMNLRHALQDEGVTWEAISRSRPQLSGIKTEVSDDAQILAPVLTPRATPRTTPRITPPNAPTVAQVAVPTPLKPLPSRKQLPKFTKMVKPPAAMNDGPALQVAPESSTAPTQPISRPNAPTNDGPSFETSTAPSTAQTIPRPSDEIAAQSRPSEAPSISNLPPPTAPTANLHSNASSGDIAPMLSHPLPRTQAGPPSRTSNPSSGLNTPVPTTNDAPGTNGASGYRPLSERVRRGERTPSPFHGYGAGSPPPRSRSPDRFGGMAESSYSGAEPERGRRSPAWGYRTPPDSRQKWSPVRRSPTPPRYTPPRNYLPPRAASPPYHAPGPAKRPFSGDHYSPGPRRGSAPTSSHVLRRDSPPPPRGPRHGVPRAPSYSIKRQREDDYTPPSHPQKRFKDDGRDVARAPPRAASPPRSWIPREPQDERPALELRLGTAPDPDVHFIGRGESYRPQAEMSDSGDYRGAHKPEGLLSRLSDPSYGNQPVRGKGGARGRPNNRARGGRGRGERSLVDRME